MLISQAYNSIATVAATAPLTSPAFSSGRSLYSPIAASLTISFPATTTAARTFSSMTAPPAKPRLSARAYTATIPATASHALPLSAAMAKRSSSPVGHPISLQATLINAPTFLPSPYLPTAQSRSQTQLPRLISMKFSFISTGSSSSNFVPTLITLPTAPGIGYQVQFTDSLSDPQWQNLLQPATVVGTQGSVTDPSTNAPQRFYRIVSF